MINLLGNNKYLKKFEIQVAYYTECNSVVSLIWNISDFAVASRMCRQDFISFYFFPVPISDSFVHLQIWAD